MSFNITKCKVMHIGTHNPHYKYYMDGQELLQVQEEKDIGVLVSNNLKPKNHCTVIANKARGILFQIAKNFHFRDKFTFIRLYKMYVRPHLEYAVAAWCPWLAGDIETLENVQRKAVRMVSGLRSTSYEDKLIELGMDSLVTRRLKIDLVETFKIIRGFTNVDKHVWFRLFGELPDQRFTRLAQDPLNIKRTRICNTDIRNNFYSQRVIQHWNRLPTEIKNARSISSFKHQLKKMIT